MTRTSSPMIYNWPCEPTGANDLMSGFVTGAIRNLWYIHNAKLLFFTSYTRPHLIRNGDALATISNMNAFTSGRGKDVPPRVGKNTYSKGNL